MKIWPSWFSSSSDEDELSIDDIEPSIDDTEPSIDDTEPSIDDINYCEKVEEIYRDDLPWYTNEDVLKYNCFETGIWTTFRGGVYDITTCIDTHPGGMQIILAAGKPLEEFFNSYQIHLEPDSCALSMLEECRIGNIITDKNNNNNNIVNEIKEEKNEEHIEDVAARKYLVPHTNRPFNGEAPVAQLKKDWITPTEFFYIRSHHHVPKIDPTTYYFEIKGIGIIDTLRVTLDDLLKLPKTEYLCTFQCAGNRRNEMSRVKKICGPQWALGGISNALWGGVLLTDLLKEITCDVKNPNINHVIFQGYDGNKPVNYEVAIPFSKALDPFGDVLVAYEMNGQPLTPDHGYPVRMVVPGHAGARSCKWLASIELSTTDSESHWQKYDFKFFPSNIRSRDDVKDWDEIPPVQELPVYSSFMSPEDGQRVQANNGSLKCEGYAWSGAGRKIIRVEVSLDNGENWLSANLTKSSGAPARRDWCWTFWTIDIPIPSDNTKEIELCVRGVDSSYNSQPKEFTEVWNFCGIVCNAWHRIKVSLDH